MSSEFETYKILIAGDQELGFSLCARFIDRKLVDPRMLALESLAEDWPEDEWRKLVSVSLAGNIHTLELHLELHGPWVWTLYGVMEPRDYFRRFEAAIIAADPRHTDSYTHLPSFIESIGAHIGGTIPMIVIADTSEGLTSAQLDNVADMAKQLDLPFVKVNIQTGENVETVFKKMAQIICEEENP